MLTAAHCLPEFEGSTTQVVLGFHNQYDNYEENFEESTFYTEGVEAVSHPLYGAANTKYQEFDIALIRLKDSVVFSDRIQPICLPIDDSFIFDEVATQNPYISNTLTSVTGFGLLDYDGGDFPEELMTVNVPLVNSAQCNAWYQQRYPRQDLIAESMFCAGYENGNKDACLGDSGGPISADTLLGGNGVLLGVVSWGVDCAQPQTPGVYTRITYFKDWIEETTGVAFVDLSLDEESSDINEEVTITADEGAVEPSQPCDFTTSMDLFNEHDQIVLMESPDPAVQPSRCLDIQDGVLKFGKRLIINDCDPNSESQKFVFNSEQELVVKSTKDARVPICVIAGRIRKGSGSVAVKTNRCGNSKVVSQWEYRDGKIYEVNSGHVKVMSWKNGAKNLISRLDDYAHFGSMTRVEL